MNYRFTLYVLPFILLLLEHLSPRSVGETDGRKNMFGAIGSSVLLDPEYGAALNNSEVIWEFTDSDGKPVPILDYVPGFPQEEPNKNFRSRLLFITSNGSLMLNNLQPSDQGVYTITVGGVWKGSIILELIEPLSEPFINVTYVHTAIKLACQVSAGKASSIQWQKDEKMITNAERYWLVQGNSMLIISDATLSGCGIYTCTVENPVSQKNVSYPLAIYDLHFYAMPLSIVALITAVVAFALKIISFLKASSRKTDLLFAEFVCELFENLLQIVQYLPLVVILGYWIWLEGPDKKTVSVLVFFCLLAMPSVFLICDRSFTILKAKSHFLMLMVAVTAAGELSVLCTSTFLIAKPKLQAGNECEPVDNLQTNLIFAAFVPFILVLILFAGYIIYRKWNAWRTRTPTPNPNVKEADDPECIELVAHHLNPAVKSCRESGTMVPGAELVSGEELPKICVSQTFSAMGHI
ncbi:uncharacterized protein LOC144497662 [Mustelus asterias]